MVDTWDELDSCPITHDPLHSQAVLIKKLPDAPAELLELLAALMPWFKAWTDHPFWKEGVWVCRIDEDSGQYTSQRHGFLAFHTDMTRYLVPPMYTIIRCVHPDPTGGANLLVHIDDVMERLTSLGRNDILHMLHEPRILNLAEGGRPLVPLVPRDHPRGVTRVFDRRAADKASHLELTQREGELFDELIRLCPIWTDLHVRATLRAGELIAFSNHRFLHARTDCGTDGRVTEVCLGNCRIGLE